MSHHSSGTYAESPLMHAQPGRPRFAARVLLIDPTGAVLLLRFVVPRAGGDYAFWVAPGGEIEPGEEPRNAAAREVREELGWEVEPLGPVHSFRSSFEHEGEWVDNNDTFFYAQVERRTLDVSARTELEQRTIVGAAWFTPAEIMVAAEDVYPPNLAAVVLRLGTLRDVALL